MAGCATGDVVYIGDVAKISQFFSNGIDGVLSSIGSAIMSAAVDLFSDLSDVPTLAPGLEGEAINGQIRIQVNWLVVTIAVGSMLVAAFRMALERKGSAGVDALKGLIRMIVVSTAAWAVVGWIAKEADRYSTHLYDQGMKEQLKLIAKCGTDGLTAFLLIIVGLLLLIAGVIHTILMYIRLGVMTLLVGTLPMAAAASMSEVGLGWWRKHLAWMTAWLLYKPTVGLIMYGGAAMLSATEANAKQLKLAGAGILLMAGVALPALMRLVVPAVAAMGREDGSAAGAGAAAGGVSSVASGAKKIPSIAAPSGSGSGGGGGGGGPSGSRRPTTKAVRARRFVAAGVRGGLTAASKGGNAWAKGQHIAGGVSKGALGDD